MRFQSAWYLFALTVIPALYPMIYAQFFAAEHGTWQDLVVLMAIGLTFFSLVFLVPDSNPLLANPVGDFVGKVSYSWYFLHLPVLVFFEPYAQQHPLLILPVFITIPLLTAYVVYQFFEAHSRRGIRKLVG